MFKLKIKFLCKYFWVQHTATFSHFAKTLEMNGAHLAKGKEGSWVVQFG